MTSTQSRPPVEAEAETRAQGAGQPPNQGPARSAARSMRPPHRPRHRILTLIVVVLLIAIPAGYLVQSAFQSRASGREKQREAAVEGLTYHRPSKVQQRIYDVRVPPGSSRVAFYETNAWKTNRLYVQFRTTDKNLDAFLNRLGTDESALREGRSGVPGKSAHKVGWDFGENGHHYAGTTVRQHTPQPDLDITVDTTYKNRPRVYVVSTAQF